jgi:hypothetical protein
MEAANLLKIELEAYEIVLCAKTQEEQFYGLCDYLKFLRRNNDLTVLVEDIFEGSKGIYLQVGESLFSLLGNRKINKLSLWSDVLQTVTGGGNRDLMTLSNKGDSVSVARSIHSEITVILREREVSERVEIMLDEENGSVYLKKDPLRCYEIKSRGEDSDKKRFKIILVLYQTSKWLPIKTLANKTGASDEPTALKQVNGINKQFKKETGLTHSLIVRQKKDNKYLYQLNHEGYYLDLKPAGS